MASPRVLAREAIIKALVALEQQAPSYPNYNLAFFHCLAAAVHMAKIADVDKVYELVRRVQLEHGNDEE